jgi:hypothetical protein
VPPKQHKNEKRLPTSLRNELDTTGYDECANQVIVREDTCNLCTGPEAVARGDYERQTEKIKHDYAGYHELADENVITDVRNDRKCTTTQHDYRHAETHTYS